MENEKKEDYCSPCGCCHLPPHPPVMEKKMHCVKHFFTIIFLIILSLVGLVWIKNTLQESSLNINTPRLTVSAEGKVTVKPDLVKVNFSVVSQGDDYLAVQKDGDEKMAQAIGYLKGIDIKEEDIKTVGYNLTPNYDYDWCRTLVEVYRPCPPKIINYNLRQQVEVKIREIEQTGEILSNLPQKGVNEIYSPVFTVDDPEQFRVEARNKAIMSAQEKAKTIANVSGISLGKVMEFSESDGGSRPIYEYSAKGMGGDMISVTPSPIEAGSQDISVTVSISYQIK